MIPISECPNSHVSALLSDRRDDTQMRSQWEDGGKD
jgi:hypothetical protein